MQCPRRSGLVRVPHPDLPRRPVPSPTPPPYPRHRAPTPSGLRPDAAACPLAAQFRLSGPSPVDRARPGSKPHVLTEGAGVPLAVSLTGGNRNDVTELLPLIDKVPQVR